MTIIRRPNTNYIPGLATAIAKADNSGLDAVDVTIRNLRTLLVCWSGPLPTVTGQGLVARVPTLFGSTVTFNLTRMFSRLEVLPITTTSFRTEKSSGGGVFSASTIATLSHSSSDYEKSNTALTGTVQSGDLVRIYFPTLNGNGGTYLVELQGDMS